MLPTSINSAGNNARQINPSDNNEAGGGRGGYHPPKVFLSFFLEDKTSAPEVFSSCSFIPRAHLRQV